MPFTRLPLIPILLAALALPACGQLPGAASLRAPGGFAALEDDLPTPPRHNRGYDRDRVQQQQGDVDPPQGLPRQGLRPTKVDLRKSCPPIYNQGDLGACTAFAIAKGLRETVQNQRGGQAAPQSALFFYYAERALAGTTKTDAGATIADGMKVLTRTGSVAENYWPYTPAQFAVKPPAQAYAEAGKWKLAKSYHLGSLDDVKTSLANGHTVAMGFVCYASFDKVKGDGMLPMPGAQEKQDGGHACLAVGYDDQRKVLIVRNSYGRKWGDAGHFYMPYAYAGDRKRVDEYWTAN